MGLFILKYNGRSVALTTQPNLAPRLKKEYSYIYTPSLDPHGEINSFTPLLEHNYLSTAKESAFLNG
jgi:hypothetical protein